MSDLYEKTLVELHQLIIKKEITITELTAETFQRLSHVEPKIEAFLSLNQEKAMEQAQTLDQQGGIQPNAFLAGIPIALKDNAMTKNLETTAASNMLQGFIPPYNATFVEKLKDADSILIGKTNMDEFAMGGSTETSYYKKTYNAWNLAKVPGGSSGGSAAAVAAGVVPVAFGSDTGGSIRQPSAFNGIVGFKPTYGRVSRYGLIALGSTFDQIGPMTRSVADNAYVLNVIAGHDPKDATSSTRSVPDYTKQLGQEIRGLKIAVPKEYMEAGIQPEVKAAVEAALNTFKKLGAIIEEVRLPHVPHGVSIYYILACAEGASNMQRLDGIRYGHRASNVKNLEALYTQSRSEGFGEEVKRRITLGTYALMPEHYHDYFERGMKIRTLLIEDFKKVFQDYDLIVAPTTPTVAYGINEKITNPVAMYMGDELTIPANLAGIPAMSIPCGFSQGLPIGLQLMGNYFDEETIYRAADAFEQATDFHGKIATMTGGKPDAN